MHFKKHVSLYDKKVFLYRKFLIANVLSPVLVFKSENSYNAHVELISCEECQQIPRV